MAMADSNKVVVHVLGGKILKGTTQDFFPNRPIFHLQPTDGTPSVELRTRQLKAVFFVRDFAGDPTRRDVQGFIAGETTVELEPLFETYVGTTSHDSSNEPNA